MRIVSDFMEESRREFFDARRQWKSDMFDFQTYWEGKKFEYIMQFAQENVLTKPQIERRLEELRVEEAPPMPACVPKCHSVTDFYLDGFCGLGNSGRALSLVPLCPQHIIGDAEHTMLTMQSGAVRACDVIAMCSDTH